MLRIRRMRVNPLFLVRKRSKRHLPHKGVKGKAKAIEAKAKVNPPKVGEILGPPIRRARKCASYATN